VHQPKQRPHKVADDPKAKAQEARQRRELAIANTTGIRTLAAIAEAVPVRLMKRDLLSLPSGWLPCWTITVCPSSPADTVSNRRKAPTLLKKLFVAYLRRAEESVLRSVLVETTILYMSTRLNPAQVLQEAATLYKVDTNAIALKVKQEFAAKEKSKKTPKTVSQAKKAA
jgi:ParB family chromosome partitioning protein